MSSSLADDGSWLDVATRGLNGGRFERIVLDVRIVIPTVRSINQERRQKCVELNTL